MKNTLICLLVLAPCFSTVTADADDHVLTLTEGNFASTLSKSTFLVVEFYAPWCGHCKQLEPEYKKAASILVEQAQSGKWIGQTITLAKVDATVEKALATKFNIRGFPTLKIFENGSEESSEYEGPRDADGIVTYLKSRAGPASTDVSDEKDAQELLEDSTVLAVYTGADVESWMKIAQSLRGKVSFAHTSNDAVKSVFGVEQAISVVKKFDEKVVGFDGDVSEHLKLTQWIDLHRFEVGMAIQKGDQLALKLVFEDERRPNVFLFLATASTPSGTASLSEFKKAAMSVRGKMVSGYFELPNFPEAFEHFGLKAAADKGELPVVMIEDRKSNLRYRMEGRKVTEDEVLKLLEGFQQGSLSPFLKSEEPPASNDGPVRVVVANTFDQEVLRAGRWVLLEVYAPWCGHCKKLAPIYDEVGNAFAGQGVVVAKVDATANDLPQSLNVTGFPTLLLFRGDGSPPETFNGERSWAKITAWVTSWTRAAVVEDYTPPKEILQESAGGGAAAGGDALPLHMRVIQLLAEDYQVPFMEAGRTVPGLYVFALVIFLLFVASISLVVACLSRDPTPVSASAPAPAPSAAKPPAKKTPSKKD